MPKLNKICCIALLFFLTTSVNFSSSQQDKNRSNSYVPKSGFVPDKETAIKIAEAIWLPIYGEIIYKERPFTATLNKKGNWEVYGSFSKNHGKGVYGGGVAYAEIRKKDCKIIRVIHTL
ncbi:MAG: hypothetical protein JST20_12845 [Bacteroidetes bacterium]|nr:hypothetical protein [Bacteroidota bacterium]